MSGTCVIGLQWGDEAKGKLVDLLAPRFDLVVRYQGGANAGHTVVAGDETYKLHHIPSGILHPEVQNLITPGVVINPSTMLDEIDGLAKRNVDCRANLRISERAHLVMPWHMAEDKFINAAAVRGESIGTTNRGIGPCYRDKVGRTHAIRMADLTQNNREERIGSVATAKRDLLKGMGAPEENAAEPFIYDADRQTVEVVLNKKVRSRMFREKVIEAYDKQCALTGMRLINGGGRAEVQAAHIKSVEANGPDSVNNGIALSGTIHWMFDRGLLSISDDYEILVSRKVNNTDEVARLINKDRKAILPKNESDWPHPRYLEWHRDHHKFEAA